MTTYALISDIHANLPALRAVLADIAARPGVTDTYHLGDLVGYAPWPNEVVALLAERGITGISGNYDSTVALRADHCGCRAEDARQEAIAHASFAWMVDAVTDEVRRQLAALPFRMDLRPLGGHRAGPTVTLLHGNQTLSTVYTTEDRPDHVLAAMAAAVGARAGDVICVGHTHKPWHRVVEGVHVVNTGSVGRPKDGDPRAGYVLLHVGAGDVRSEVVRVAYDVESAAAAIEASALPNALADFLRSGGRAMV